MRFFGSRFFESRFFKSGFFNHTPTGDVEGILVYVEDMDDISFFGDAEQPEVVIDHRDRLRAGSSGTLIPVLDRGFIRGILLIEEEPDRFKFTGDLSNDGTLRVVEIEDVFLFAAEVEDFNGARVSFVEDEDGFKMKVETFDVIGHDNAVLLTILLD